MIIHLLARLPQSRTMKFLLLAFLCCQSWIWVSSQGYMPYNRLRKAPPVFDGNNDIYQSMEIHRAIVPEGMAVLYASSPIFSPVSKDPEKAAEVYAVLPESEAVKRGAGDRRLLEDALIEMGFPLEELTHFDANSGRVVKVTGTDQEATESSTDPTVESTETPLDVAGVLDSLQGPLPYLRRGAWGK